MIGAVDIGGTKIAVGMVDDDGRVLSCLECPTDADRGYRRCFAAHRAECCEPLPGLQTRKFDWHWDWSTGPVDPLTGEIGEVNFFPALAGQESCRPI